LQSVLTGFAMVGVSQTPLTTPWILTSIVLVVFAVAMFGYTDRKHQMDRQHRQIS
jgi:hypothetical protein